MRIILTLVVVVLLIIVLYSNIRVEITFNRHNQNDILIITIIVLYGIFRYKKQIPFMDIVKGRNDVPALELKSETIYNEKHKGTGESVVNVNEFEKLIDKFRKLYLKFKKYIIPFSTYLKPKVNLNNITWNTEIGIDDAAQTAVLTGVIWTIKSTIISLIHNNFNLYDVFINVVPNYNIKTFKTSIDCIFSIKLGNIINAGAKTLLVNIKDGVKK